MFTHHTKETTHSQSTPGIYPVRKNAGETVAVLVGRFRKEEGLDQSVKITYAGRLDPMAEGVVLLLVGEARFKKDAFLRLQKTYELQILLGLATDSADMLGIIEKNALPPHLVEKESINRVIDTIKSITSLPYPRYSSVPVDGVPLFVHARAGREIARPQKKVAITKVSLIAAEQKPLVGLIDEACVTIEKVEGDFRQEAILAQWRALKEEFPETPMQVITIRATVSSGTYMRSLAEWFGTQFGIPALAYHITRFSVGDYIVEKK